MKFRIDLCSGTTFLVDLEENEQDEEQYNVATLKRAILKMKNLPLWSQQLIFQGKKLDDNLPLSTLLESKPTFADTQEHRDNEEDGEEKDGLLTIFLLVKSEFKLKRHPLHLLDPINGQLFEDPVRASDGCTYSKQSLLDWIASFRNKRLISPTTGKGSKLTFEQDEEIARMLECYLSNEESTDDGFSDVTNIDELGVVFSKIDHIREDISEILQNWKVPQVAVVGNESTGKSTLLERLAMMPLFPRAERRCTRMRIEIRLRRGPNKSPHLMLFSCTPEGDKLEKSCTVAMELGSEGLQKEMDSLINEDPNMPQICPDKYLVMEITNTRAPNLDLVDLPGIIALPEDEAKVIEKMITDHYDRNGEYSMYLFVMEARRPVNQSPIAIVKQRPEMEKNTLGVMTCMDKIDPAVDKEKMRELVQLATGEDCPGIGRVTLKPHGFVLTSNASAPGDDESGFSPILQRARREPIFFNDINCGELMKQNRAGCKGLISRLNKMYWDYLNKQWLPKTVAKINAEIEKCKSIDVELGLPRANLPLNQAEREELLDAIVQGMKRVFKNKGESVMKKYETEKLSTLHKDVVSFVQTVSKPRLDVNAYIQSVVQSIENACESFLDNDLEFWKSELKRVIGEDTSTLKLARFEGVFNTYVSKLNEKLAGAKSQVLEDVKSFLNFHLTKFHSVSFVTYDLVEITFPSAHLAETLRHLMSHNIQLFHSMLCDEKIVREVASISCLKENCAKARFKIMNKLELLRQAMEGIEDLKRNHGTDTGTDDSNDGEDDDW